MAVENSSTKRCSKCGEEKLISEFHVKSKKTGRPRPACKPCTNGENSAYNRSNKDVIREASARYRERHPDRAKMIAKKWQSANRAHVRSHYDEYRRRTLAQHARRSAQRRAQNALATPKWANKVLMTAIYQHANLMSKILGVSLHVDHVVPLQSKLVCGLHNEFNFQILSDAENIAKRNWYWPDMP
jgi:hypothetical protein